MADEVEQENFTESSELLSNSNESKVQSFEFDLSAPREGLSMVTATFFVIGNILGAGLVAIPYGAKLAGWLSIPFFVFIPIITCCCGVLLAKSVNMTVANDRRDVSREPYPQLAKEAVGNKTRKFVVVTLYCGQIMSCLVFLLLAGEILSKLIPFHFGSLSSHNELRVWISITIGFIIPFNLLGSPKDFWGIALVATVTSVVTAIFMCTCLGMVHYNNVVQAHTPPLDIENVFASFGIIVFSFSGVGIFPTVQGDMKEPDKFPKVVVIGFTTLSVVYVSVALTAFFVLGNFIGEDLLTTLSSLSIYHKIISYKAFVTISQVLILGHVLSAFVLQMNPVYQLVEVFFKTPNEFCWQRCVIRISIIIVMWILAIVIPNFGPALSLVGGTFNGLLSIVFPLWFYVSLQREYHPLMKVGYALIFLVALVSILGNAFVELKNLVKVMEGKYKHV